MQVFANEVSFSGLLMDVSRVIPPDAVLTTSSPRRRAAAPRRRGRGTGRGDDASGELIGTMTFDVTAAGIDSVPDSCRRLAESGMGEPVHDDMTETAPRSRQYTFQARSI